MAEGGQEITELKNKFVDFLEREVSLLFSAAAVPPSSTFYSFKNSNPTTHCFSSKMMHNI
jgi:hypothetical protein